MAYSKVMVSASSANPDLSQQSSSSHSLAVSDLQSDHSRSFGSTNMDELFKNIYPDPDSFPSDNGGFAAAGVSAVHTGAGNKTVDEVWKEIVAGSSRSTGKDQPEMTLEDFLTNAGAMSEEEVRAPVMQPPPPSFGVDGMMNATTASATVQYQAPVHMQLEHKAGGGAFFGVDTVGFGTSGGVGRGKKRVAVVEEVPLDKATLQKRRRMIKNRESAAKSRERKQAYNVELESIVTRLEEENARLLREEVQQNRERFKQLMENLIPVVEQRRPPRFLRRVNSMTW